MASGSAFSIAGASISLIEDITDDDDDFELRNYALDAASIFVSEFFNKNFTNGAIGVENLYLELGFTVSSLWFEAVSNQNK